MIYRKLSWGHLERLGRMKSTMKPCWCSVVEAAAAAAADVDVDDQVASLRHELHALSSWQGMHAASSTRTRSLTKRQTDEQYWCSDSDAVRDVTAVGSSLWCATVMTVNDLPTNLCHAALGAYIVQWWSRVFGDEPSWQMTWLTTAATNRHAPAISAFILPQPTTRARPPATHSQSHLLHSTLLHQQFLAYKYSSRD